MSLCSSRRLFVSTARDVFVSRSEVILGFLRTDTYKMGALPSLYTKETVSTEGSEQVGIVESLVLFRFD